jgi:hypothetical protein
MKYWEIIADNLSKAGWELGLDHGVAEGAALLGGRELVACL